MSKLAKLAQIENSEPLDPSDYKNTHFVNFEPRLWAFIGFCIKFHNISPKSTNWVFLESGGTGGPEFSI